MALTYGHISHTIVKCTEIIWNEFEYSLCDERFASTLDSKKISLKSIAFIKEINLKYKRKWIQNWLKLNNNNRIVAAVVFTLGRKLNSTTTLTLYVWSDNCKQRSMAVVDCKQLTMTALVVSDSWDGWNCAKSLFFVFALNFGIPFVALGIPSSLSWTM